MIPTARTAPEPFPSPRVPTPTVSPAAKFFPPLVTVTAET